MGNSSIESFTWSATKHAIWDTDYHKPNEITEIILVDYSDSEAVTAMETSYVWCDKKHSAAKLTMANTYDVIMSVNITLLGQKINTTSEHSSQM